MKGTPTMHLSFTEKQHKFLKDYSKKTYIPISALIRKLVDNLMEEENEG